MNYINIKSKEHIAILLTTYIFLKEKNFGLLIILLFQ